MGTPMVLPKCDQHGQMEHQKSGTKEQEWCGVWYRCTKCSTTTLFSSAALAQSLARPAEVAA